ALLVLLLPALGEVVVAGHELADHGLAPGQVLVERLAMAGVDPVPVALRREAGVAVGRDHQVAVHGAPFLIRCGPRRTAAGRWGWPARACSGPGPGCARRSPRCR